MQMRWQVIDRSGNVAASGLVKMTLVAEAGKKLVEAMETASNVTGVDNWRSIEVTIVRSD